MKMGADLRAILLTMSELDDSFMAGLKSFSAKLWVVSVCTPYVNGDEIAGRIATVIQEALVLETRPFSQENGEVHFFFEYMTPGDKETESITAVPYTGMEYEVDEGQPSRSSRHGAVSVSVASSVSVLSSNSERATYESVL